MENNYLTEEIFVDYVMEHMGSLLSFARGRIRGMGERAKDENDLVMNTIFKIINRIKKGLVIESSLKSFIYTVLSNECNKFYNEENKNKGLDKEQVADEDGEEDWMESKTVVLADEVDLNMEWEITGDEYDTMEKWNSLLETCVKPRLSKIESRYPGLFDMIKLKGLKMSKIAALTGWKYTRIRKLSVKMDEIILECKEANKNKK